MAESTETVRMMLPEEELDKRIRELGKEISEDYAGDSVYLVGVLRGAASFTCELAKRITIPVTIDFMSTSSYGAGTTSSGEVVVKQDIEIPIEGRNVIICEDIIDSGNTLHFLLKLFRERKAKSVKLCALLDKPDRREVDVKVDYTGFTVPDEFIVGYGLDYDQKYRNLPYIGVVEF